MTVRKLAIFLGAALLSLVSGETALVALCAWVAVISPNWVARVIYGAIVAAYIIAKSIQLGRASRRYFG